MRARLLLVLLLVAGRAQAQGYVGGFVLDSATGAPLPCVQVALVDTLGHVMSRQLTTTDGMFQLDAPPHGMYRLRFFIAHHDALSTPVEEMAPTMERARKYALTFRVEPPSDWRARDDTAADAPPGLPLRPKEIFPRYPLALRESGIQGEVMVHFLLDSTGRVVPPTIQIVRSTRPEFAEAVRTYLARAEITPARFDHHPACALMLDMPFTFRLGP